MLRGVLRQLSLRNWRGGRELHEGDHFLTALRASNWPPQHSRPDHARMRVQHRFHFRRVDILSKANDQLLGASNNKQISVFHTGKVAGVEPSLGIYGRSRL